LPFISGSALKLYLVLWRYPDRKATASELAQLAGIGRRTISAAMEELRANQWIDFGATRGDGYGWILLALPSQMPDSAISFYRARFTKREFAIESRRILLEAAVAKSGRAKRVELEERLSGIAQRLGTEVKLNRTD
jgi:hypothetical protein